MLWDSWTLKQCHSDTWLHSIATSLFSVVLTFFTFRYVRQKEVVYLVTKELKKVGRHRVLWKSNQKFNKSLPHHPMILAGGDRSCEELGKSKLWDIPALLMRGWAVGSPGLSLHGSCLVPVAETEGLLAAHLGQRPAFLSCSNGLQKQDISSRGKSGML